MNNYKNTNLKKRLKGSVILILEIIFILYIFKERKKLEKTKVCICTIGKEENRYVREWVEHYEKYGVDKIYLYDNNDLNGEHFESVIDDYVQKKFIKILNWRGKRKFIYKAMNDCYNKNSHYYDWLIFYELDEFIHLHNHESIKEFLNKKKFDKCEIVYLNLLVHNDNNQLFYQNLSLFERFPNIVPMSVEKNLQVKMIIKGGINNLKIKTTAESYLTNKRKVLKTCDRLGKFMVPKEFSTNNTDYKFYYVDHFFCKSTEEFTNKLNRGDTLMTGKNLYIYKLSRIKRYFKYNNFTSEKIKMMEKLLKIKSSEIIKWIKKK